MAIISKLVLLGCAAVAQASLESIAGYTPGSSVTDHNALDLDQDEMQNYLGTDGTVFNQSAYDIYTQGGHSKSYAEFTYSGTLTNAYASGQSCQMTLASGGAAVTGTLKSAVSAGTGSVVKCYYPTGDVQATYQACQVGGLPSADQVTTGCIDTTKDVVLPTAPTPRRWRISAPQPTRTAARCRGLARLRPPLRRCTTRPRSAPVAPTKRTGHSSTTTGSTAGLTRL
jgi:hypothetical protein